MLRRARVEIGDRGRLLGRRRRDRNERRIRRNWKLEIGNWKSAGWRRYSLGCADEQEDKKSTGCRKSDTSAVCGEVRRAKIWFLLLLFCQEFVKSLSQVLRCLLEVRRGFFADFADGDDGRGGLSFLPSFPPACAVAGDWPGPNGVRFGGGAGRGVLDYLDVVPWPMSWQRGRGSDRDKRGKTRNGRK